MTTTQEQLDECITQINTATEDVRLAAIPLGRALGVSTRDWFDKTFLQWLNDNAELMNAATNAQFAAIKQIIETAKATWPDQAEALATGSDPRTSLVVESSNRLGNLRLISNSLIGGLSEQIREVLGARQGDVQRFTVGHESLTVSNMPKAIVHPIADEINAYREALDKLENLEIRRTDLEEQLARESVLDRWNNA